MQNRDNFFGRRFHPSHDPQWVQDIRGAITVFLAAMRLDRYANGSFEQV
jgi:hypothetical protein